MGLQYYKKKINNPKTGTPGPPGEGGVAGLWDLWVGVECCGMSPENGGRDRRLAIPMVVKSRALRAARAKESPAAIPGHRASLLSG
jgi:hypothetical protein